MKKTLLSLCLITAFANSSEILNSYIGYKNYGLAKQQFDFEKAATNRNIANQASEYNTGIQNAGMELADNPNARALRQAQLDTQKILAESETLHVDQSNFVSALGYSDSESAKGLKYTDDLAPLVKAVKQSPIDSKKWLFAISVEKYDEADPVIYATNSANSFISVMQKRLGIDERHMYALLNEKATTGGIKGGLERLLQNVQPGDSIYFYYSGHGIPDPKEGEPYILPRDVIADYVTREKDLMARSIYKKLSDSSASRIVAFVDSCYSGRTDGISNIKGAAAGHFKSKQVEFDKEKMAVFTAGTNGQFSNAFPEKGNRLFSYYLTKALATKENLDLDTLSAEVYANVKEESLKMGDIKRQEPQIEGNRKIGLR